MHALSKIAIQYVKGIGPSLAKLLAKLDICTVEDFLYTFPKSYDDRRRLPKISQLVLNEVQTVVGRIEYVHEDMIRQRLSVIKCTISDETARMATIWFNQAFLLRSFKPGYRILVKGKLERNEYSGEVQFLGIDYELFRTTEEYKDGIGKVVPVYPLTGGVSQYKMRCLAKTMLAEYIPKIVDPLPKEIQETFHLPSLSSAITELHFPTSRENYTLARRRIVFDEFFYFQLALMQKRFHRLKNKPSFPFQSEGSLIEAYRNSLPYQLTTAQEKAINDIHVDVRGSVAMNRLLQGDVGSGKTDVAVMALLLAIQAGYKGAVMAPTEILAVQHYSKFKKYLEPMQIPVVLLKGKLKGKERVKVLEALASDTPMVVIGTHALIEADVGISRLGLIVIDEQHRFGVIQRSILQKKGFNPHCLFMTATPIPRSLMLTVYGDLFKTIMDEMPPGRKSPQTAAVRESDIEKVYAFCKQQIRQGFQVYIVYPLVEESEKLDLKAAVESAQYLQKEVFSDQRVGLLHGKMKPKEKESIMDAFKAKAIDILVATTVIEVGIDVPNATVMVIQHAQRFGLSQLHQLRGRIGRGGQSSYCFLVATPKSDESKKRIKAMTTTTDGFKIAEIDLQIRGPGDVLGTRQSGMPEFNIADLIRDEKVLILARKIANHIVQKDPYLTHPMNQRLKEKVESSVQMDYTH